MTSALVVIDILSEDLSSNTQIFGVLSLKNTYEPLVSELRNTSEALSNVTCAAVNRTALITHYNRQREALRSSESRSNRSHGSLTESNSSPCKLDLIHRDNIVKKATAIVYYAMDLVAQVRDYIDDDNAKSCFS